MLSLVDEISSGEIVEDAKMGVNSVALPCKSGARVPEIKEYVI